MLGCTCHKNPGSQKTRCQTKGSKFDLIALPIFRDFLMCVEENFNFMSLLLESEMMKIKSTINHHVKTSGINFCTEYLDAM